MLGRPKLNRATRLKLKRGSRPKLNRSTRPILGARSGPLYNERSPKVYKIDKLPYVENFKLKDRLDKLEELLYSDYDNE